MESLFLGNKALFDGLAISETDYDFATQPVMYQTGYLTIADYDDGWYRLDFPNNEVKQAFNRSIVEQYTTMRAGGNSGYVRRLAIALKNDDLPEFEQKSPNVGEYIEKRL